MFEFAPLGLIMLGTGTVYLLVVSRWLLPDRRGTQLTETYQLGSYITELRVSPESPLVGKSLAGVEFGRKQELTVLEILPGASSCLRQPMSRCSRMICCWCGAGRGN
jgi:di/tricarboxylate transporter